MNLVLFSRSLNYMKSVDAFFEGIRNSEAGKEFHFLDVNTSSIQDIERAVETADLVVFDISIILAIGFGAIQRRDFYIVNGKPSSFYEDVWSSVRQSSKAIFLLAFTADLHVRNFGLKREIYVDIIKRISAICWPYYSFPFDPEKDPVKYTSSFLTQHHTTGKEVYDIWKEITDTVPVNIDLPHCLADGEILKKEATKKWDFIVPGNSYITRRIAFESALNDHLKMPDYRSKYRWYVNAPYQFYSLFTSKLFSTKLHQKISSNLFRRLIARSEVSFACGSELKYFVRKFLEIPAEHTALVAVPTNDFGSYGFIDAVHYLATEPQDAGKKAKYLLQTPNVKEQLKKNALQLVIEKHSAGARAQNVWQCIQAFQKGKLKTASFVNGNFEIR